ncbi:hypothetical protein [Chamaesiphon sp. OTE_8_metabat_110]|uniref:hypothetical protein n=1 Tax=Chamaesiphon sp. OTE_8_metabat_110 TaxID=2964696 RepID=UPI00286C6D92|nr:hypothetical protein [Chamaesiphon sp. OTE_8_metabat_110]
MKLSTMNWLSKAIVLPLFTTALQISPVGAQQIQRAPRISLEASSASTREFLPLPTDLNLRIPAPASTIIPENREPSNSIEPIWANPDRHPPAKSITNRAPTTRSIVKKSSISSRNSKISPSITPQQANQLKPNPKRKNSATKNLDLETLTLSNSNSKSKYAPKTRIAARSNPPFSGNYLRLVRDPGKGTNDVGNPIYTLEAYVGGQKYQTFDVVSGTARSQNADRDRGNNAAPLPDGLYAVSSQIIPGDTLEVGKTFIGIFPQFETGRNSLGIHLDRSFNQTNGYDGTAGCIGMTTPADRDAINEFVLKYRPQKLSVNIISATN